MAKEPESFYTYITKPGEKKCLVTGFPIEKNTETGAPVLGQPMYAGAVNPDFFKNFTSGDTPSVLAANLMDNTKPSVVTPNAPEVNPIKPGKPSTGSVDETGEEKKKEEGNKPTELAIGDTLRSEGDKKVFSLESGGDIKYNSETNSPQVIAKDNKVMITKGEDDKFTISMVNADNDQQLGSASNPMVIADLLGLVKGRTLKDIDDTDSPSYTLKGGRRARSKSAKRKSKRGGRRRKRKSAKRKH